MIILTIIIIIIFVIPFISGLFGNTSIMRLYGVTYSNIESIEQYNELDELHDINKSERIELLDQALIKYNQLLDNLKLQYSQETDEKKRATILAKQISTLEKLNKALEKREKLE